MAVLRLSFTNLAEATSALASGTGQACDYCSTEAQQPQRPFHPWRTLTTTTTQEWVLDLGSSQTADVIALVNAGFTSATIQGASSSGLFAAAPYSEAVVLTCSPFNWRYQHTHLTTGFGYRWLRVKLDATTSTALTGPAAGSTYFSLGGVWVGALTSAPNHLRIGLRARTVLPKRDVGPSHGAWMQRLKQGNPRARLEGIISASADAATPGLSDELRTWQGLLGQAWSGDYFFAYMSLGDPSQGYVVRWLDDPEWVFSGRTAETQVVLDEVVGP
ncbi:MAG: hypothetical protein Q7J56_00770 [Deltaproteobacteria bacterium]|nr:hypothetical protein [Deltaproteobacteria bacterium]